LLRDAKAAQPLQLIDIRINYTTIHSLELQKKIAVPTLVDTRKRYTTIHSSNTLHNHPLFEHITQPSTLRTHYTTIHSSNTLHNHPLFENITQPSTLQRCRNTAVP